MIAPAERCVGGPTKPSGQPFGRRLLATTHQPRQSAVSPQQNFPRLSATNTSNCLTCRFVVQPTQLSSTNAQVVSFASSRSEDGRFNRRRQITECRLAAVRPGRGTRRLRRRSAQSGRGRDDQ
jgi:hypothetical protein